MRARYPKQMKHRWTSYASTEGNFLGLTRRGGHGMPGPVIKMSFMIDPYMKIIDDPQKKALYDLLASTNRPAMYAKELEICNKLLESNR